MIGRRRENRARPPRLGLGLMEAGQLAEDDKQASKRNRDAEDQAGRQSPGQPSPRFLTIWPERGAGAFLSGSSAFESSVFESGAFGRAMVASSCRDSFLAQVPVR